MAIRTLWNKGGVTPTPKYKHCSRAIKYKSNAIGVIHPCVQSALTQVTPCPATHPVKPFAVGQLLCCRCKFWSRSSLWTINEAKYWRECMTAALGDNTMGCPPYMCFWEMPGLHFGCKEHYRCLAHYTDARGSTAENCLCLYKRCKFTRATTLSALHNMTNAVQMFSRSVFLRQVVPLLAFHRILKCETRASWVKATPRPWTQCSGGYRFRPRGDR